MGGADDLPHRSSSPLKRRASNLEAEEKDDVDMITVPDSTETSTRPPHARRVQSVDMMEDETQERLPHSAETEPPSIDAQITTVTTFCKTADQHQLSEGDKTYLVSKKWLSRVVARGSEAMANSKVAPEGDIGPVDNSDIIHRHIIDADGNVFAELKHGLGQESFDLFPQEAWDLVMDWYGVKEGQYAIDRYAHNTNSDKTGIPNIIYEFHPPIFTIHRLWSDHSLLLSQAIKEENPPAAVFVVSRSVPYVDFLKRVKTKAGIDLSRKVRVWRVPRTQPAAEPVVQVTNLSTPPSSRPGSPIIGATAAPTLEPQDSWTRLLLDVATFSQLKKGEQRELVDSPDQTVNPKYNGHSDLAFTGLGENQTIVLDEQIDRDSFVSNYTSKGKTLAPNRNITTSTSYHSNSQGNSGRSSPAPSGYNLRGRSHRSGRALGTVGLSNLGNTCYMNSALQCVRSVEELTKYFLTGSAAEELNVDNPLGNNGDVALAYDSLLKEIYKEPVPASVTPRQFKNTIGRYAPSFSGYGQQDSQEFLGFLLDGLQEDLSRVKKKPYIEKPDSTDEMVNNPEAIREMAAQVWDITKKRDDSVIADLFTGMYKSTLVCPICGKVSITFDPFNNLTLQLPIENSWSHTVYFFPLNDAPMMISVDMDRQGSIASMKEYMSKKVGVPVERLFVAEEFKCKFYKIFDDYQCASDEIGSNDNIAFYELEAKPTNWPPQRKAGKKQKFKLLYSNDSEEEESSPGWATPAAEHMLVPVFYRRPNLDRSRAYKKNWVIVPVPHYIMLTAKEARSEDTIRRKLLEKVATFTTSQELDEDDEASGSAADSIDPDIVLTNGSNSSNGKVTANSIDGEDGLVDVSMESSHTIQESVESNTAQPADAAPSLPTFNKRRPKFVQPGSHLNPMLQNMFDIGYFASHAGSFPIGWSEVDDDKAYPNITSRLPVQQDEDAESGNEFEGNSTRTGSESSGDVDDQSSNVMPSLTSMTEESSDEDILAPQQRALAFRTVRKVGGSRVGYGKGRARRGMKTYSKKGKHQAPQKLSNLTDSDQDTPDDGPLIRPGEGIVVDWSTEAYNALFEGDGPEDHLRGRATFNSIETFHDTELLAKRTARSKRRKNGITLDDCLNEFGKEEVLSEADTWYCPRCKEHQRATKKFELWKTPDILIVHLKRFSSSSSRRDKLDVLVDFPIEGLDLTSRVVEPQEGKEDIYDLIAVDDHWGGLGGGHYTAFAKNFIDGEWYEYNDTSVSKQKDPSRVVSQSAYLLFYRRRSEGPLGGPRFQEILTSFDDSQEPSEDELAGSGEDQSLAATSSLHGSSSALTGVEAARRQANRGLGRTVKPHEIEGLPAYKAHEEMDDDAAPLLLRDAQMNDGLPLNSIEDEGIDMDTSYNNIGLGGAPLQSSHAISSNWTFQGLEGLNREQNFISGTGSEVDLNNDSEDEFGSNRSVIVQHNSSASSNSIRGRLFDFDNTPAEGDGEDGLFEDPSPVPDIDEDNGLVDNLTLHRDLLHTRRDVDMVQPEFKVTPGDAAVEFEEPATEIHVEDGEGLKID